MKFIKLTDYDNKDRFVEIDAIEMIAIGFEDRTVVYAANTYFDVLQTPQKVLELIDEA